MGDKKDFYTYIARLTEYDNNSFDIEFVDFENCFTSSDSYENIIKFAKDRLQIEVFDYENENKKLPEPSKAQDIKCSDNQFLMVVEVYMPIFRENTNNSAVKKTLTIPYWLNELAKKNNINFSQVLQSALKRELYLD